MEVKTDRTVRRSAGRRMYESNSRWRFQGDAEGMDPSAIRSQLYFSGIPMLLS